MVSPALPSALHCTAELEGFRGFAELLATHLSTWGLPLVREKIANYGLWWADIVGNYDCGSALLCCNYIDCGA